MSEFDSNSKKKKKKPMTSKYNYTFGNVHPGVNYGHKRCLYMPIGLPVPGRMGWLWNAKNDYGLKPRRGWHPGAIGKSIAKMMTFKCAKGAPEKDKKKKKRKPGQETEADSEPEEPLVPKPALKVQRKGDVFTIQVNPLKDLEEIKPNEDPYVDCDPIVFKIIKKRSPEEQAKVEARKMVKLKKQRDEEIRMALKEASEDICMCAYMDVYCNDLSAIDKVINACPVFKEPECVCEKESMSSLSSNASWDIEYTPPFGCFDLSPRKRKDFIHVDTQYVKEDAGIVDPPKIKCKKTESEEKTKKPVRKRCSCRRLP